jgi:hypothetical protein
MLRPHHPNSYEASSQCFFVLYFTTLGIPHYIASVELERIWKEAIMV